MKSLKEHRFEQHPQEKVFFDTFVEEHGQAATLDLIIFGANRMRPKDYLTQREREIVCSTIQWLGSPVGQAFLGSCGYEKIKTS